MHYVVNTVYKITASAA